VTRDKDEEHRARLISIRIRVIAIVVATKIAVILHKNSKARRNYLSFTSGCLQRQRQRTRGMREESNGRADKIQITFK